MKWWKGRYKIEVCIEVKFKIYHDDSVKMIDDHCFCLEMKLFLIKNIFRTLLFSGGPVRSVRWSSSCGCRSSPNRCRYNTGCRSNPCRCRSSSSRYRSNPVHTHLILFIWRFVDKKETRGRQHRLVCSQVHTLSPQGHPVSVFCIKNEISNEEIM